MHPLVGVSIVGRPSLVPPFCVPSASPCSDTMILEPSLAVRRRRGRAASSSRYWEDPQNTSAPPNLLATGRLHVLAVRQQQVEVGRLLDVLLHPAGELGYLPRLLPSEPATRRIPARSRRLHIRLEQAIVFDLAEAHSRGYLLEAHIATLAEHP